MALRILICPDKFKGTLGARKVADALARGWHKARPQDRLDLIPMSDGGDGFGEVLGDLVGAVPRTVKTINAAHQPIAAKWWWHAKKRTAIIESANVIGLALLPPGRFHPFELDTFGLGNLLTAAAEEGATRCIIGVGGSATNDGGFGLAQALGWEFFDAAGHEIHSWTGLSALAGLAPPRNPLPFREITVAVDVRNTLLGPLGCSRVYGPQKGLRPADFRPAESALRRLAFITMKSSSRNDAAEPGSGAAGGLGFGLMAFAGARVQSGFGVLSQLARLEQRVRASHLVLTGEGAIDRQTFMGKGVGQLVSLCRKSRIPCLGFAGSVAERKKANRFFNAVWALTDIADLENAKRNPGKLLTQLAFEAARLWDPGRR